MLLGAGLAIVGFIASLDRFLLMGVGLLALGSAFVFVWLRRTDGHTA